MKDTVKRGWALALALVLTVSVCVLFSVRKQGMFIDEIYTYGLSNSRYRPFLGGLKYGEIDHRVVTREELLDYVSITEDEGFDFASVYDNQVHDVHPPLYYWLFNIASTLARGRFSKWIGLSLDGVLYLAAVLLLYILVRKLGGGRYCAAATALLYGLSAIGLSTMVMIRMYVLLTLLTALLMVLIADLMRRFRPRTCVFVGLTLLAGLLTQYYFVFYAFFLCAAYVLWALWKKQVRALAWFIPCALLGALSLLLVFPAALSHLFSGELVSGESAAENLKNLAQYPARLRTFTGFLLHGLKAAIYTGLAALPCLCLGFKRLRGKRIDPAWLVLTVPALLSFVLVAVISPVDEARYIYNLIPAFVLCVGFLLHLLEGAFDGAKRAPVLVFLLIAALGLWEARCVPPDYLYPEHAVYNELLDEHREDPCVFFAEPAWAFVPMTEDLIQLLRFPEVYVTDQESLAPMLDYVGDAEEVVVYIDVSEFWSSGYDAEALLARIAAETDYKEAEELFTTGLSTTCVISK